MYEYGGSIKFQIEYEPSIWEYFGYEMSMPIVTYYDENDQPMGTDPLTIENKTLTEDVIEVKAHHMQTPGIGMVYDLPAYALFVIDLVDPTGTKDPIRYELKEYFYD